MERNLANEILTTLHESSALIDKTLGELKDTCPEEPFRACARLLGVVMSDMFDTVMAPIYDEHPDLAPDWYRDGPPRGTPEIPPLSLTKSARQALLASFNAAYEKVQRLKQPARSLIRSKLQPSCRFNTRHGCQNAVCSLVPFSCCQR